MSVFIGHAIHQSFEKRHDDTVKKGGKRVREERDEMSAIDTTFSKNDTTFRQVGEKERIGGEERGCQMS